MEIKYAPGFFDSMDREFSMKLRFLIPRLIRDGKWEVIYAWQRLTKGYDERDVFSLYSRHTDRTLALLKELKEIKHGFPIGIVGDDAELDLEGNLTEDASDKGMAHWDHILTQVIEGFEAGKHLSEADYFDTGDTWEVMEAKRMPLQEQFEKGMALFTKHYFNLWD